LWTATGHAYFYNTSTGETAWEVPPEEHIALKGWELTVDTTSSEGLVYYTNLATKITQWDMPSEMDTFDALENLTELNVAHNRLTEIAPVGPNWIRLVGWLQRATCNLWFFFSYF
jgi:Leucine-rich repeat (LRR) protein